MKDKLVERKSLLNGVYPEEYTKLSTSFSYGILVTVMAPEVGFFGNYKFLLCKFI
jgi:hypothetical protein